MHELSIAMAVVTQVEEAVHAHGGGRVASLRLRIGELAGVVPEALRFSFGLASEGTVLAGARLDIDTVPGRARCTGCGRESDVGMPPVLWCDGCARPLEELLSGRELEIAGVVLHGPSDAPHAVNGDDRDTPEEATHVPSR
ncbi:hydrogenase maturation nickel metallochaperone HypA [Streptomyces sp. AK02-01A]|uniref:hydrogenase maturation nickel metallochaperone HypA/HybF n=1 Tax=Streptomyces sp. AK02-01A TaxID=3028648 RepID=UPI0029BDE7D0|nr:hydrogenase maturation nickel metallochaperone HypA [Streptomyces sp. AK02-01A]MDX3850107.1 hydrogenase maturation nickel metallochaperone HypA [Streptomyces sp. AK02-01A]